MARAKKPYHHGNLRNALVEAAVAMIADQGTDALSMRELARRVDVDHRAAYFHFADRQALMTEVAEQGYLALIERVETALREARSTTPERLLAFARAYIQFAIDEPGRYRVMMSPRPDAKPNRPHDAGDRALDILVREVTTGIARGELRDLDATLVGIQLWSQMHGLADLLTNKRLYVRASLVADYTRQIVEVALDGVSAASR